MLLNTLVADPVAVFAEEVRAGLSGAGQKELPSKYLYDEIGSALFEVITLLPEYGLTRADESLLRLHSGEIAAGLSAPVVVAELGSGSGKKARWILQALARCQPTTYYPIEISHSALAMCERELDHIDRVSILGFETEYLDGLRRVVTRRRSGQHVLVLFLGSSIGNFDPGPAEEFLQHIRSLLVAGDALLLSTDLLKPVDRMVLAYDDPAGVTAAFNLNLLGRINRELEGDFDLCQFHHRALYNRLAQRIEMHLVPAARQSVRIHRADCEVGLEPDETIWTESSYKYSVQQVRQMAERAGFRCEKQWVYQEWPFALNLLAPD